MLQRLRWPLLAAGLLLLAGACTTPTDSTEPVVAQASAPTSSAPDLAALPMGWNRIEPGGATGCSDGSDFAFYVRPGDPKRLLVFLQGGGACWNLQTCDPLVQPTYTVNLDGLNPDGFDGIFNYQRSDNPFKDHTVVFAPYCSADVHIGRADKTYTRSAAQKALISKKLETPQDIPDSFDISHRGFDNVASMLDWTYANVTAPESVFVTGSSAGSIPSPYYALHVANAYPQANVTQLGDGAGGYRRINQASNPNLSWNTVDVLQRESAFAGLTNDNFNYEQLYIRAAAANDRVRFNAYDAAEDNVQKRFLQLGGVQATSLQKAITANQNDIRETVPGFRSYIAGGDSHTILRRPEFYTYRVGSTTIRDWVAALANGAAVDNVACNDCQVAATTK
ncbi:MAG: pectin acetylesterase-family hydrolase [Pseudomonadales bacterium]